VLNLDAWEGDDVPRRSVWLRILGVVDGVLEGLVEEPDGNVLAHVRPKRRQRHRCGICGRRSPLYDQGEGRRRWRGLDVGYTRFLVEAAAPRVSCQVHGVVVARVPWARHGSRFLRAFEDQVAWLATQCSQQACSQLMRLDWETVGRIITRVVEEASRCHDRLDGLERIGIDEISWRKGQRYLTLVIDHVTGRLVWAAEGRSKKVVDRFFEQLGPERCAQLTHVSSDGAEWILGPVEQHCPNATICLDPFHVVEWATSALDKVRRAIWNDVRRSGQKAQATELKGSRWVLLKNAQDLSANEATKLAQLAKLNAPLYRAYLLKEHLRMVFHVAYDEAIGSLERWLQWARRCRIGPFVALARTITYYRADIEATLLHGVTNGRVESLNTKVRLIARRAFGFRSAQALIALAELTLGGLCPPLPGRQSC
jgi:transposase